MIRSKLSIPIIALVIVCAAGLLFSSVGRAGRSAAQDAEKSLDIERYPNEPLELVDIKVSGQSVKDKIKVKNRRGDHGLDSAKFTDKEDWFKRVSVRLRNVSGKPIIGLMAHLNFAPPGLRMLFSVGLTPSKQLEQEPLKSGEEIDLTVSERSWGQTANILKRYGVDANLSSVTLSVEIVAFSDRLQWSGGHMLQPDPNIPNKWIPVDNATPETSRLDRPVQFTAVAFKPGTTRLQSNTQCVTDGGYIATHCSENGYCYTIERLGGGPGTQSIFPEVDICKQLPGVEQGGVSCADITTHLRLEYDASCPIPTPTPTPTPTPAPTPTPEPTPIPSSCRTLNQSCYFV